MATPFGRQTSREALQETTRHFKSSLTEGSSRIFGSVMGAKKGFFDGITSTFDQVVNIVGSGEEENQKGQNENDVLVEKTDKSSINKEDEKPATVAKTRPPKPPAPVARQRSDLEANGTVKHIDETSGGSNDQRRMTEKPPLKRRNTNPFMDDYDPSAVEPDLPNTVVAEVHNLVSALYSDATNQVQNNAEQLKRNKDGSDAESEGTEGCDEQPDLDELDQEHVHDGTMIKSGSRNSDHSWSNTGDDANLDPISNECAEFMKYFVLTVFDSSSEVTPKDKSKFGELSQNGFGRMWFARCVSNQKMKSAKISEETFYGLVQFYTIVLFECNEAEDYGPAKALMDTGFVFFCEAEKQKESGSKQFLFSFLKDLPIWHSPRYWNAAFFYAIQHERANTNSNGEENKKGKNNDHNIQEISFRQLSIVTSSMRALGLSKEHSVEFIRRQSSTANLTTDQIKNLKQSMERWTEQSLPCFQTDDEESGAFWFISKKAKAVNAAARLLKDGWHIGGGGKGE